MSGHFFRFLLLILLLPFWRLADAKSVLSEKTASVDLKSSLSGYVQTWSGEKSPSYKMAFIDLNDDGVLEAVVYLMGENWCGSGGCTTLILKKSKCSWKVVSKITLTHLPIRALADHHNGWHDLGVWVQGGGIIEGYEADLKFNGLRYPTNPTVLPARQLNLVSQGSVLIDRSNVQ